MKNRKIKLDLIIGLVLIALLAGGCCVYQWWQNRHGLMSTVIPEELEREATIEKIYYPEDMVTYMIHAAQSQDLDMALRGFPIDERCLSVNTSKIIESEGAFSNSLAIAPSARYSNYFPVSSAELTGELAESYEQFAKELSKYGNLEIISIDYARPDVQTSSEYQRETSELCEIWGAKTSTEMCVLLTDGSKFYVAGMTLIRYDDYWKIFSLESQLAGTTGKETITAITEEEYDDLAVEKKQEALKKVLEKDDTKEQKKEWKENEKEVQKLLKSKKALLPPNYFVVNRAYGKTPEDTIEKFTLYLQRYDLTSMINYGNGESGDDLDHVTAEALSEQKDFAIQIKNFYFNLLRGKDGTKEKKLKELGQSADEVVGETDPNRTFYMDLMSVKETDKSAGEYTVSYWYANNVYKAQFFMKESEEGWWIDEIGAVKKTKAE